MKQITVGANTYKSISAAWRAISPPGLPMITVRWRLNHKWLPEDAFLTTQVPAEDRRTFKEVRAQ